MFSIIITAGGIGKRMGSEIPKQFIPIHEQPLLMHTIAKFHTTAPDCQIILTLPEEWIPFWKELLQQHQFPICHEIIAGGKERYHSIQNALPHCRFELIGVHDGVRPLVSSTTILQTVETAKQFGTAIPVTGLKESIRFVGNQENKALNRSDYVLVQTPQFFEKSILNQAYAIPFHDKITDDASLVEEAGYEIHLVQGNEENIKVTTPLDLIICQELLKSN